MAWGEVRSGRSLDRLINFSDAVVAVAITLLALPLTEIIPEEPGETMGQLLFINLGLIQTFVVTFIVVGIMWNVHNKIVNNLGSYDTAIFWLFILWLIGFAFLPFPSRLYTGRFFDDGSPALDSAYLTGAGVLYWLTLAYICIIGALTARHMDRHPDLIEPESLPSWQEMRSSRARFRGTAFAGVFLLGAVLSYFVSWLGNYCLILLVPIGLLLRSPKESQTRSAEGASEPPST